MKLDLTRVRANISRASTDDLMDRATVYRGGMELEALDLIDAELVARGIGAEQLARHRARQSEVLVDQGGLAERCSFCHAPALVRAWGWLRLWGTVPVLPWRLRYCREHLPPI